MILLIDNYDSFVYNLVQTMGALKLNREIKVIRNDAASLEEIESWRPRHILISPGPCTPNEAGISVQLVQRFAGTIPILGVCLGHQCIGQAFGGRVVRAPRLMHGKTSPIKHDGKTIFRELSNPFTATRYHSLCVETTSLPKDLEETAWTADRKELMGVRHKTMPVEGVQFHPESFLTEEGSKLIENFLHL